MISRKLSTLGLAAALAACQVAPGDPPPPPPPDGTSIDEALLAQYKRALPKQSVLEAPRPGGDIAANPNLVLGQIADYPKAAYPVIVGINTHIKGLIDALQFVTSLPPTAYNSDTLEFVWGPFDDDQSEAEGDKVLVYVKDNGEGQDFRYTYALARGVGNDVATYVPVIVGGSNPNPDDEDRGNGVTLWDFEKNREFMDANYPDHGALPTGRFAAVFSRELQDDGNTLTIVLASLRGFSEDGASPGDLDHLWGHVDNPDAPEVSFVDIETAGNLIDTTDAQENLSLRVAFVENVGGRGEAVVTGGDLHDDVAGDSVANGIECFDGAVARTYFDVSATDPQGATTTYGTEGTADACGGFASSLDDLGVPGLDDVPPELLDAVINAAENGA